MTDAPAEPLIPGTAVQTSHEPLPGCEGCPHVGARQGGKRGPNRMGCAMLMIYVSPCWVREQEELQAARKDVPA